MHYAQIAIPRPLNSTLTYIIPDSLIGKIKPGYRVSVPFRKHTSVGFVMEITQTLPKDLVCENIKEIKDILDNDPIFSTQMLDLLKWMSKYYCAPIGEVCKASIPSKLIQIKPVKRRKISEPAEKNFSKINSAQLTLNSEQAAALNSIINSLSSKDKKPILLHGVTGSGKTEVYLQAFEEVEKMNAHGILLVPEISLTPQLVQQFQSRFGEKVAIYHSGLTDAQRFHEWEKIRDGKVFVVVGTRSALFAPFKDLKLIIVDEEHDASYKQDEGFLYNGHDSAIVRANIHNATIVLASATPCVESFINYESGKYNYHYLATRATGALLPDIEIVDMRTQRNTFTKEKQSEIISPPLFKAIEEILSKKEQALLFLNRRGFANFILCRDCGHVFECPNCNIALTHHMLPKRMICHYCEFAIPVPDLCVKCNGTNLKPMGQGTEQLEEELAKMFPDSKIARLDKDTSTKASLRKTFLSSMQQQKIDILVGTQIIAKGHDFPNVTLVGVINADTSLHLPDFRSYERTFQLLTQVSGRSGRGDKPGKVIIQTFQPEHPSIIFTRDHDFKGFVDTEKQNRKALNYPPFTRMANIRFQSNTDETTSKTAKKWLSMLKTICNSLNISDDVHLLGPAPCPLHKIRGKYRWQLLIKAPNPKILSKILLRVNHIINSSPSAGCRITIDVDPINMM